MSVVLKLHGLMLTESVVRFPNHLYQDDSDEVILSHRGVDYQIQMIVKFECNDCHYAVVVNKEGVLARVPGIKSLVNICYQSVSLIRSVMSACTTLKVLQL